MNEDLGLYKPQTMWAKPKIIAKAIKHETQKAADSFKETIDDLI